MVCLGRRCASLPTGRQAAARRTPCSATLTTGASSPGPWHRCCSRGRAFQLRAQTVCMLHGTAHRLMHMHKVFGACSSAQRASCVWPAVALRDGFCCAAAVQVFESSRFLGKQGWRFTMQASDSSSTGCMRCASQTAAATRPALRDAMLLPADRPAHRPLIQPTPCLWTCHCFP